VQVLADPPELDSSNPNFNVFQIARLISVTPYTLQLIEPEELASDIVVNVALNSLTVDLGALQDLFPDRDLRFGTTFATPNLEFGTRNVFVGIRPQGEARNTARLDPTLQAALGEGAPFQPNTLTASATRPARRPRSRSRSAARCRSCRRRTPPTATRARAASRSTPAPARSTCGASRSGRPRPAPPSPRATRSSGRARR
jgi:hypothetical protein